MRTVVQDSLNEFALHPISMVLDTIAQDFGVIASGHEPELSALRASPIKGSEKSIRHFMSSTGDYTQ